MIGIYLSETGNTKHCVEKLLYLLDDTAKSVPLEHPQIMHMLEKQDTIILGYPTQYSNAPIMVRDFIKRNAFLWKGKKVFCVNTMGLFRGDGTGCRTNQAVSEERCTMCYRCISLCPQKAITLIGNQVWEQCRYEKYE